VMPATGRRTQIERFFAGREATAFRALGRAHGEIPEKKIGGNGQ